MSYIPTFGKWSADVHAEQPQKTRIERALRARTGDAGIDYEQQVGRFFGSEPEPYVTTLNACTCMDFQRRNLPCKHMYRLALELGAFGDDKMRAELQMPLRYAIDEVQNYTAEAQALIKERLYESFYHGVDEFAVLPRPEFAGIRECAIFEPAADPWAALGTMKRDELIKALDAAGASDFKRNAKRDDLVTWARDNRPGVLDVVYTGQISTHCRDIRWPLYSFMLNGSVPDYAQADAESEPASAVDAEPAGESAKPRRRGAWLLILAVMFFLVGIYGMVTVAASSGLVAILLGAAVLLIYARKNGIKRK